MSNDDPPPRMTRLTFHGPLSETRAARLVDRLTRTHPATVLDLGCGWGELLLRTLEAVPGAAGTGIDLGAADLARGRDRSGWPAIKITRRQPRPGRWPTSTCPSGSTDPAGCWAWPTSRLSRCRNVQAGRLATAPCADNSPARDGRTS
jgi:hypothetical protein